MANKRNKDSKKQKRIEAAAELEDARQRGSSVLLSWVQGMSWKCQSILQGGFRGPDNGALPAIKSVNRWLRISSQQNADPGKPYMKLAKLPSDMELCEELEFCTCHYTHHFADALRCLSIYHPEKAVRKQAWQYHFRIAEELFHFMPETDETFVARHVDKVEHD